MPADPRWLVLLKSSFGQSLAGAIACGGFLLIARWEWMPKPEAWMVQAAVFGALLFSLLAFASLVGAIYKRVPFDRWLAYRLDKHRKLKAVEKYLPFLTKHESNVLGYLLKHNQKMFTGAADGGYAITLISRGIVVRAMRAGQQASALDVPYMVPDDIWDVLSKHKDKIRYKPELDDGVEVHPWREPLF
jgi:hypothetical protein